MSFYFRGFGMKKIEKKILKIKVNIVLTILWVVLSGLYWNRLDISDYEKYAKDSLNTSTIAFDVESENGYILNVTDNPKSDDLEKLTLKVYNETYMANYYKIALKLDKKCDYKKLNILINSNEYNLHELLIQEDADFYYFILGENELIDTSDIYEISLFVNSSNVDYFLEQDYLIDFVELNSIKA